MRALLRALLVGSFISVASVAPALAAVAPPPLNLTMDPTSGPGGTLVGFTPVDNCPVVPGYVETATLALTPDAPDASVLATSPVDGAGAWSLSTTIPDAAPLGAMTFYVECRGVFTGVGAGGPAITPDTPTPGTVVLAAARTSFFGTVPATKLAAYAPATFTVTAPATTTTSTTTSSTTTSTTIATTTTTTPSGMTLSPTFMYPGDSCLLKAHGFAPGSNVNITVFSTPLNIGTFVADAAGELSTTWVVPAGFEAGNHTIVLTGVTIGGDVLSMNGQVTIGARVSAATTPTTAAPATGTLPRTGTELQPLLVTGGTLVVLGGAVVVATRRRRRPLR